jgi:hypothetical protein
VGLAGQPSCFQGNLQCATCMNGAHTGQRPVNGGTESLTCRQVTWHCSRSHNTCWQQSEQLR